VYRVSSTKNDSIDAPLLAFFLVHKMDSCKENGLHTQTSTK